MKLRAGQTGICVCDVAPMGRGGLEGFDEKAEYKFTVQGSNSAAYVRIYHDEDYYETCGLGLFDQHFKVKTNINQ